MRYEGSCALQRIGGAWVAEFCQPSPQKREVSDRLKGWGLMSKTSQVAIKAGLALGQQLRALSLTQNEMRP